MCGDSSVLLYVVCFTQQNTTIATHKRSQLLKLIETRYQLQQSYKQLQTEHTPLNI